MNIFMLDYDAKTAARQHCNKHVVKMITEYAQLLSTAHRVLDGEWRYDRVGYKQKHLYHPNKILMEASHVNHPSSRWARLSSGNYKWLFKLYDELIVEYHFRFGAKQPDSTRKELIDKLHGSARYDLRDALRKLPKNIPSGKFIPPTKEYQAIKNLELKNDDAVIAYRNYYLQEKKEFAEWYKKEYYINPNGRYLFNKVSIQPPSWWIA